MFARIVFLLLLALNIGVACWLYFAPQSSASQLPATDRGVPKLVLGDFNEWTRGLATQMLNERLQSVDLRTHLRDPHHATG